MASGSSGHTAAHQGTQSLAADQGRLGFIPDAVSGRPGHHGSMQESRWPPPAPDQWRHDRHGRRHEWRDELARRVGARSTTGPQRVHRWWGTCKGPLRRQPDDRMLGGVAAGLASWRNNLNPTTVRIVFVIAALFSRGSLIPFYFIAWLLIPLGATPDEEGASWSPGPRSDRGTRGAAGSRPRRKAPGSGGRGVAREIRLVVAGPPERPRNEGAQGGKPTAPKGARIGGSGGSPPREIPPRGRLDRPERPRNEGAQGGKPTAPKGARIGGSGRSPPGRKQHLEPGAARLAGDHARRRGGVAARRRHGAGQRA